MRFRSTDAARISAEELSRMAAPYGAKLAWFSEHGYRPHTWQLLFHCMRGEDDPTLRGWRHLVAGRRGGKTMSAAWEVGFYLDHPQQFFYDFHGRVDDDRPLWTWCLTRDHPSGFPALRAFREMLRATGKVKGREYMEHKGEKYFEFANGCLIQFKNVGDNPDGLRGPGLDILWMDEAAMIPSGEAWDVVRPALVDQKGALITTTTPKGRNWLYNTFWNDEALEDPIQGRVEYRSVDNPYLDKERIDRERRQMHPAIFAQEYLATFDAMTGVDLSTEWLNYYEAGSLQGAKLDRYIGVDPAISLEDRADYFAMTLLGVNRDTGDAFVLKQFKDRIPFAEQMEVISQWHKLYRPTFIGIEGVAYQKALVQNVARLPSMPPVIEVKAPSSKAARIIGMTPLFRSKRVHILPYHRDFIDEWTNYVADEKNPADDLLDSVEIALRIAGVVMPDGKEDLPTWQRHPERPADSLQDLAARKIDALKAGNYNNSQTYIEDDLGGEW